jgi:hypothetical protein
MGTVLLSQAREKVVVTCRPPCGSFEEKPSPNRLRPGQHSSLISWRLRMDPSVPELNGPPEQGGRRDQERLIQSPCSSDQDSTSARLNNSV